MTLCAVALGRLSLDGFDGVLAPTAAAAVHRAERLARTELDGRRIWNVNSTARGGGVAEMAVTDDPEGAGVFGASRERWQALPAAARERVHLALLPMEDCEENGAIVNALQRDATVVVQKSLAEGFGLTVAEAM